MNVNGQRKINQFRKCFLIFNFNSRYADQFYPKVNAKNNWWGRGQPQYVAGRIYDRLDDDNLIEVDYTPILTDNRTVLDGGFN